MHAESVLIWGSSSVINFDRAGASKACGSVATCRMLCAFVAVTPKVALNGVPAGEKGLLNHLIKALDVLQRRDIDFKLNAAPPYAVVGTV